MAKGRVILFYDYGSKWNGQIVADCYRGPVLSALRQTWPRQKRFTVLEDNDPTGFKSTKAVRAKGASKSQYLKFRSGVRT